MMKGERPIHANSLADQRRQLSELVHGLSIVPLLVLIHPLWYPIDIKKKAKNCKKNVKKLRKNVGHLKEIFEMTHIPFHIQIYKFVYITLSSWQMVHSFSVTFDIERLSMDSFI